MENVRTGALRKKNETKLKGKGDGKKIQSIKVESVLAIIKGQKKGDSLAI
jgi:hypothetical protein